MNRHERCLAALAGRPVDRMPRYVPGVACDVASQILGRPAHTGTGSLHYAEACAACDGPAAHQEFVDRLFDDVAAFNRAFDIDVYRVPWRVNIRPARRVDEYTFVSGDPDGDHRVFKYDPGSGEFGCVRTVVRHPISPEDRLHERVERVERAQADGSLDRLALPADVQHVLRKYGQEFFVIFNGGYISVGLDPDDLTLLLTEADWLRRLVWTQARADAAFGRLLTRYPGGVLLGGGDLAGNDGPFYSPRHFRSVMLPGLTHLASELNAAGVHYVFRSDGNLAPLVDIIFGQAGCPGYGEADRLAGMTVGSLRQQFPRLVVWGNVASNHLVEQSADQVRTEARACLDESGGTAYFHGPSNAILKGTPPANVEAMFSP